MDKRQVIAAYRRGMITIQQCAQIIGVEGSQLSGLLADSDRAMERVHQMESRTQRPSASLL